MVIQIAERHTLKPDLILNLEDLYARAQGPQAHPRPLGALQFWLVAAKNGAAARPVEPPIRLDMAANPSGYYLFYGRERLSERARRHLRLPAGEYRIRVTGDYYQATEKWVRLPINAPGGAGRRGVRTYSVYLRPGYAYPFREALPLREGREPPRAALTGALGSTLLRGSLRSAGGAGIARALVSVRVPIIANSHRRVRAARYRTDSTGQWVLWFPPTDALRDAATRYLATVHIAYPDGREEDVPGVPLAGGRQTSLHETALRGWVQRQGVGLRDVAIAVSGRPAAVRTGPDGGWTYVFPFAQQDESVTITATLPTGESAEQTAEVKRRATIAAPTIQLI